MTMFIHLAYLCPVGLTIKLSFNTSRVACWEGIYLLFAGWEFLIVKNCDRSLEPRPQFFTIRTDPKPVNNLFIFFQALERKKHNPLKLTQALL